MKTPWIMLAVIWSAAAVISTGCSSRTYDVIDRSCGSCHDASIVYEKKRTQEQWARVMFAMKAVGLKISPEDEQKIMEILSRSYTLKIQ